MTVGLSACSPRYNWRTAANNDVFTASFPAHVAKETRPIQIAGLSGSMTMTGADVEGVSFVVGVADFPPDSDLSTVPIAFANEMASKLAAAPPTLHGAFVAVQRSGNVPGFAFEISNPTTTVTGKVVRQGNHVVEMLVTGPVKAFGDSETAEARDTFLQSVSLY